MPLPKLTDAPTERWRTGLVSSDVAPLEAGAEKPAVMVFCPLASLIVPTVSLLAVLK